MGPFKTQLQIYNNDPNDVYGIWVYAYTCRNWQWIEWVGGGSSWVKPLAKGKYGPWMEMMKDVDDNEIHNAKTKN